jgi:hypothetical protein
MFVHLAAISLDINPLLHSEPYKLYSCTKTFQYNYGVIKSLIIVTTLIYKIPPPLPFPKGGITPLWQRGATCLREAASAKAGGRFSEKNVFLIYERSLVRWNKGYLKWGE